MYGYLSQIISFTDIELEKTFVFLKHLNRKLPKRRIDTFDISDTIDLDSLRIQKVHEQVKEPAEKDTTLNPPAFETNDVHEPK